MCRSGSMRYAPVRAMLSSRAPSVASVSRFWRSYSTSPTRPTASKVTTTNSPATRTLRRCQNRSGRSGAPDACLTAARSVSLTAGDSYQPANQTGDAATAVGRAIEAWCQEGIEPDAATGVRQQKHRGQHDEHHVRPAPLVRHVEDADRDVGRHADRDERAQPREKAEYQGDGDERLGREGHPA